MSIKFYQLNMTVLKFDENKNELEIKFNHYLMRKENIQRTRKDLQRGYLYLTSSSVAKDLNINISKSKRLIKKFVKLQILEPIYISKTKYNPSIYCYTSSILSEHTKGLVDEPVSEPVNEPVKMNNLNKKQNKPKTKNEQNNDNIKAQSKKDKLNKEIKNNIYINIIEKLNNKTNKNFSYKNKETIKLINSRLDEGYTENDFFEVIEIKSNQWLNSDFEKYLRPTTLFGNKFDFYLNEKNKNKSKEDEIL